MWNRTLTEQEKPIRIVDKEDREYYQGLLKRYNVYVPEKQRFNGTVRGNATRCSNATSTVMKRKVNQGKKKY
jgi:hypothetical protein